MIKDVLWGLVTNVFWGILIIVVIGVGSLVLGFALEVVLTAICIVFFAMPIVFPVAKISFAITKSKIFSRLLSIAAFVGFIMYIRGNKGSWISETYIAIMGVAWLIFLVVTVFSCALDSAIQDHDDGGGE